MFYKTYTFWALVVSVLFYVLKSVVPDFPLSEADLLKALVFILGLFGLRVEQQARVSGFLK